MTERYSFQRVAPQPNHANIARLFGHPDDVLSDTRLTAEDKRALLASWASDANAVAHIPSLRQLPDGSLVPIDDILGALKALDHESAGTHGRRTQPWTGMFDRRPRGMRLWPRNPWRPNDDDDDDPPPCPAFAMPVRNGGGGALAEPELAAA